MESNGLTTLKTFFYAQLWRKFDGTFSSAAARFHEINADGCYDPCAPDSTKSHAHAQDATISTTTSSPETSEVRSKPDKPKTTSNSSMKETVCVYQNQKPETTTKQKDPAPSSSANKAPETIVPLITLPITPSNNPLMTLPITTTIAKSSTEESRVSQQKPKVPQPNSPAKLSISRNESTKSSDNVVSASDSAKSATSSTTGVGSLNVSVKKETESPQNSYQSNSEKYKPSYHEEESRVNYYNRNHGRYYNTKSADYYNRGHSRNYESFNRNYYENSSINDDKNYFSFERTSYSNSYKGQGYYSGSKYYNDSHGNQSHYRRSNYHHKNNSYFNRYDNQRNNSKKNEEEKAQQSGNGPKDDQTNALVSNIKIEIVDDDVIIDDSWQNEKFGKRSSSQSQNPKAYDGKNNGKRIFATKSTGKKPTIVEKLIQKNRQEDDSDEEKKNLKIKTVKDLKKDNMQLFNDAIYNVY